MTSVTRRLIDHYERVSIRQIRQLKQLEGERIASLTKALGYLCKPAYLFAMKWLS